MSFHIGPIIIEESRPVYRATKSGKVTQFRKLKGAYYSPEEPAQSWEEGVEQQERGGYIRGAHPNGEGLRQEAIVEGRMYVEPWVIVGRMYYLSEELIYKKGEYYAIFVLVPDEE